MNSSRGSASRNLLLLAALAVLLLVVWRLVLTGGAPVATDSASEPRSVAGAGAGAPALGSEMDGGAALEAAGHSGARSGGALVGVRLAGPGRLEGRVIDRASGSGVGEARVELLSVPPAGTTILARILRLLGMGPDMAERVKPLAAVVTEADGRFSFAGVRNGTWYLEARGPHHAPENVVRARVLATGEGGPLDVFVHPGGRVLGKVVLPDGGPATSARLILVGGPGRFIEDAATGDLRLFETATDEKGAFVFEGVPAGAGYDVTASGEGFAISHALGIDVTAGKDVEVVVKARTGAVITGRVLDDRGGGDVGPLAGAHVAAVPRGLRDLLLVGEVLAATHCITGADGSFTMKNVPPGEVDLASVAPDHLPALGAHVTVADGARASSPDIALSRGKVVHVHTVDAAGLPVEGVQVRWNPLQGYDLPGGVLTFAPYLVRALPGFVFPKSDRDGKVTVGPLSGEAPWKLDLSKLGYKDESHSATAAETAEEITIVMHRGGSVEGVVMDAERSEPVTTFTVTSSSRIDAEDGAPSKWNPFSGGLTFEDPRGRFHLDSIAAGKVELTFSAPGYADESLEVDVVEGQATQGLIVQLRPGGVVTGVVLDEKSRPVAGAHVVAVTAGGPRESGATASVSDGPNGTRRGSRRSQRGERSVSVGLKIAGNDIPPGLMGYAASLGLLGDKDVITDARGAFVVRGVSAGSVTVRAFHRDHAWGSSEPLSLEEGATIAGVEIVLHEGGAVEGTISDRHGNPVKGDIVVAVAPNAMGGMDGGSGSSQGALYQGQSDEKGAYRIDHMAAGSYFLLVTRGDEALNPMSFMGTMNFDIVTVPENQTVKYDLVDRSAGGCRVHGIVTNQGKPVSGGNLLATNFESGSLLGIEFKATRVAEDGTFEFPGLAPGDYQLQLEDSGLRARMELQVPDQDDLFVTLAIPEAGLEGVVLDAATGEPVEEAIVSLRALDEPEAEGLLAKVISRQGRSEQRWTDKSGRFTFERLREAEYEVSASPPRGSWKPSADGTSGSFESLNRWAPADPKVVKIHENRVERGLEIRLPAALVLTGVVKDSAGTPVRGATVLVSLQDQKNAPFERDTSDDDGRFTVNGLSPGVYTATASAKDHADGIVRDVKIEKGAAKPTEVEIRLPKGCRVTVRVFGSDGQPVSGARAQLMTEKGDAKLQAANAGRIMSSLFSGEGASDTDGRIDMGRYGPGEYRLDVQRGFSKVSLPSVKIPGDRDEIELRADLP